MSAPDGLGPVPAIEAVEAEIAAVMADPSVRDPVKRFLREAVERDPLDAAADAALAARLLDRRARSILGEAGSDLVPF